MRKTQISKKQKATIVGGTVAALVMGGAAFAYWSTNGTGAGSASTSTGATTAVAITGDVPNGMYPGDIAQPVTATVKNTDANQKVYVSGVSAYLTVTPVGSGTCTVSDYLLGGSSTADADHPVSFTFSPVELGKAGATSPSDTTTATSSLQFNNKASNQDGCKGASVALHYASN